MPAIQSCEKLIVAGFCSVALALASVPAGATGTVRIVQRDGSAKVYRDVTIRVKPWAMALQTADGQGTLVIGKASCTKIDELLRCLPYDATLFQHGESHHIPLANGTVWINPTHQVQPLSYSSAHLPGHGVLLSLQTKAGTYVSLTGTIDEVQR
jgi:hypothetical protein